MVLFQLADAGLWAEFDDHRASYTGAGLDVTVVPILPLDLQHVPPLAAIEQGFVSNRTTTPRPTKLQDTSVPRF